MGDALTSSVRARTPPRRRSRVRPESVGSRTGREPAEPRIAPAGLPRYLENSAASGNVLADAANDFVSAQQPLSTESEDATQVSQSIAETIEAGTQLPRLDEVSSSTTPEPQEGRTSDEGPEGDRRGRTADSDDSGQVTSDRSGDAERELDEEAPRTADRNNGELSRADAEGGEESGAAEESLSRSEAEEGEGGDDSEAAAEDRAEGGEDAGGSTQGGGAAADNAAGGDVLAALATGDIALIDTELAEHQRWGAASARVGAAGSETRADFIVQQAGAGALGAFGQGALMGAVMGAGGAGLDIVAARLVARLAGPALARSFPIPAIGAVIGGVFSAIDLATRDWGRTGETIGRFGEGGSIYEQLANSIAAVSEIIGIATAVLNVIAGVIGAISIAMWIITVLTVGVASPLAATLSTIAVAIGIATMILDGINALVLQRLVTLFRALHTFTSEADPTDVEAQGGRIGEAAAASAGFVGGMAGGLSAGAATGAAGRRLGLDPHAPPRVPDADAPPANVGDGPTITADPPPRDAAALAGDRPPGATSEPVAPRDNASPISEAEAPRLMADDQTTAPGATSPVDPAAASSTGAASSTSSGASTPGPAASTPVDPARADLAAISDADVDAAFSRLEAGDTAVQGNMYEIDANGLVDIQSYQGGTGQSSVRPEPGGMIINQGRGSHNENIQFAGGEGATVTVADANAVPVGGQSPGESVIPAGAGTTIDIPSTTITTTNAGGSTTTHSGGNMSIRTHSPNPGAPSGTHSRTHPTTQGDTPRMPPPNAPAHLPQRSEFGGGTITGASGQGGQYLMPGQTPGVTGPEFNPLGGGSTQQQIADAHMPIAELAAPSTGGPPSTGGTPGAGPSGSPAPPTPSAPATPAPSSATPVSAPDPNSLSQPQGTQLGLFGEHTPPASRVPEQLSLPLPEPVNPNQMSLPFDGPGDTAGMRPMAERRSGRPPTRSTRPLTDAEVEAHVQALVEMGVPREKIRRGNRTGYFPGRDIITIGPDVNALPPSQRPTGLANPANTAVEAQGVLAHEAIGHREAELAGQARDARWHEEFQASTRAALHDPNLSPEQRRLLMQDAAARLRDAPNDDTIFVWTDRHGVPEPPTTVHPPRPEGHFRPQDQLPSVIVDEALMPRPGVQADAPGRAASTTSGDVTPRDPTSGGTPLQMTDAQAAQRATAATPRSGVLPSVGTVSAASAAARTAAQQREATGSGGAGMGAQAGTVDGQEAIASSSGAPRSEETGYSAGFARGARAAVFGSPTMRLAGAAREAYFDSGTRDERIALGGTVGGVVGGVFGGPAGAVIGTAVGAGVSRRAEDFNAGLERGAEPIVERVNPAYPPPPGNGTRQEIVDMQNRLLGILSARANAEALENAMASDAAHHEANSAPLSDLNQRTGETLTAAQAHQQATEQREAANQRQQAEEANVGGTLSDYGDRAAGLVAITGPLEAFTRFTSLAHSLPDSPRVLVGAKRGLLKMNSDGQDFLNALNGVDGAVEEQQAATPERNSTIEANAGRIAATSAGNTASQGQLGQAQAGGQALAARNDARAADSRQRESQAAQTGTRLDSQAEDQRAQITDLAAQWQAWAQAHRQARLDAMAQTRAAMVARGWRPREESTGVAE